MVDSITLQTIMDFEGFRSKAYWDENAWRVGYGSDTWTDSEGKVHKVTKGTSGITRDQALTDLKRRIPEFQQEGIIKHVGQQAWNQLAPETKAAVTSLAYNYGSLSKLPSLRRAIQSGNAGTIAEAIKARANDNGGLNKGRRIQEAALVTPLSPVVPPRRPDAQTGASAVAAIDSLVGTPPVSAAAYAPASGSLQATPTPPAFNAVRPGVPGAMPRGLPPLGRPAPLASNIPPIAGGSGADALTSGAGRDRLAVPSFVRPGMPGSMPAAPSVPIPRIDQQTLTKYAETRKGSFASPPGFVPQSYAAPGKQDRYVPPPPSLSPKPRQVQTVAIDPMTGGIAKPPMSPVAGLNLPRRPPVSGLNLPVAPVDPNRTVTFTDEEWAKVPPLSTVPASETIRAEYVLPKVSDGRYPTQVADQRAEQAMTRRPPPVSDIRLSANGVPVYQPSIDKTAIPYTPNNRPPSAPVIVPPTQAAIGGTITPKPYGPYNGPIPGGRFIPPTPQPLPGYDHQFGVATGDDSRIPRGEALVPAGLKGFPQGTSGTAVADFPQIPKAGAGVPLADVLLPRRRPPGGSLPNMGRMADMGNTGDMIQTLTGPQVQLVGEANTGHRPFVSWWLKNFGTPQSGNPRQGGGLFNGMFGGPRVSTALSTSPYGVPPGGNSAQGLLSGAQIDAAQNMSKGDSAYQSLIEWAMSS